MTEQAKKLLRDNPGLAKEISADFYYFIGGKKFNGKSLSNDKSWWDLYIENIYPEKDYEILSFSNPKSGELYDKGDVILDSESGAFNFSPILQTLNLSSPENLVAQIHSVKRLSDGEVFTVGDYFNLHGGNNNYQIESFLIFGNLLFAIQVGYPNCAKRVGLAHLKKSRTPLFKTEDGVDVFNGDEVFYTTTLHDGWSVNACNAKFPQKAIPSYLKYFSTRKRAEEYVKLNQPKYSLNNIIKAFAFAEGDTKRCDSGFLSQVLSNICNHHTK